ncbi:MAG: Nuclease [Deltaproteobacteria bacterium]|nr:Nuclease [Deltaproteobacteria bacterium]
MPRYTSPLRWLLLTLAASLFTTSPAYPWGSKGHEIIAAIAETHLTDTTRKRIKELLRNHSDRVASDHRNNRGGIVV